MGLSQEDLGPCGDFCNFPPGISEDWGKRCFNLSLASQRTARLETTDSGAQAALWHPGQTRAVGLPSWMLLLAARPYWTVQLPRDVLRPSSRDQKNLLAGMPHGLLVLRVWG